MSEGHARMAIRFVLSNNLPVSISRITADTASRLARLGVAVTVAFPVVDWLDYQLWQISRHGLLGKVKWLIRLMLEIVWKGLFCRRWCGFTYYRADPRIQTRRYLLTPPWTEGREREVTIVHHTYVIPHLLRGLADHARIVGMIHNPFEAELNSPVPIHAAWKAHCVAIERALGIPRVAVSEQARRSAERLGIRVDCVIPNGIDLTLFRLPASRRGGGPLTVTLSCATHPQKGQQVGVEALRRLKARGLRGVRFCSLGYVLRECADVFDHQYGFLHGEAYAQALQATDIFVYPSLYDGFALPPLEAMACGCALVTTAVGEVTTYAVHGQNCLACPPGDPQALCECIVRLVEDESLRRALQQRGPETAQAYGVERTTDALLDFLNRFRANRQEAARAESPGSRALSRLQVAEPAAT